MQIICQIVAGIPPQKAYTVIPDRASAIRYAVENAKPGDLILLAGKGHERYQLIGLDKLPFCEREIIEDCKTSTDKISSLAFAEKTVFRTCKNEGMRYSMQCIYQGFSNGLFCLKI